MRKEYLDIEDLAKFMIVSSEKFQNITYAVVFYEDAIDLMTELMKYTDIRLIKAEIEPEEYNGYSKEYYVILDSEFELSIEKAWHDDNEFHKAGYFGIGDGMVLLSSDVNSLIINAAEDCHCVEVEIVDLPDFKTKHEIDNEEECDPDFEYEIKKEEFYDDLYRSLKAMLD